jgi:hypothetical protein
MKICIKCGSSDRNKSGDCKACSNARAAAWRVANQERAKQNSSAYYAANKEQIKENVADYRAQNPEKVAACTAAWQKANPDKCNANTAKWAVANQDKVRAKNAAWHAKNSEKVKAKTQRRRKQNPEWARLQVQNRRARTKGTLSRGITEKLFVLQKGLCACCSLPLGENYHLDHIMPLALGGANTDNNMQLLRQRCNTQKGAKHPVDFMQQRGFLI